MGRNGGRKGLDHQSLDLVLESADLAHEVGGLVCGDGSGDDGAGDTAGATEGHLGGNVCSISCQLVIPPCAWGLVLTDVCDVLVLAEKRDVEEDGKRSGVGGEDDDFGDTTVEGLGGLVGTLLQLTVVGGLLDQIEDVLGEGGVGDGPGGGVVLRHVDLLEVGGGGL